MSDNSVIIYSDGTTVGIKSTLTDLLELPNKQRVSHVEPVNYLLRKCFHFIRKRVKEDSFMYEFTRHWPCMWQARMVNGPVLGPFKNRRTALAAEVVWLKVTLEYEET